MAYVTLIGSPLFGFGTMGLFGLRLTYWLHLIEGWAIVGGLAGLGIASLAPQSHWGRQMAGYEKLPWVSRIALSALAAAAVFSVLASILDFDSLDLWHKVLIPAYDPTLHSSYPAGQERWWIPLWTLIVLWMGAYALAPRLDNELLHIIAYKRIERVAGAIAAIAVVGALLGVTEGFSDDHSVQIGTQMPRYSQITGWWAGLIVGWGTALTASWVLLIMKPPHRRCYPYLVPPRCRKCGFDLTLSVSPNCPECGFPIPPDSSR